MLFGTFKVHYHVKLPFFQSSFSQMQFCYGLKPRTQALVLRIAGICTDLLHRDTWTLTNQIHSVVATCIISQVWQDLQFAIRQDHTFAFSTDKFFYQKCPLVAVLPEAEE